MPKLNAGSYLPRNKPGSVVRQRLMGVSYWLNSRTRSKRARSSETTIPPLPHESIFE